jgi:hypothetical protein
MKHDTLWPKEFLVGVSVVTDDLATLMDPARTTGRKRS